MTTTRIRWFNALLHRGPGYDLPSQSEAALRTAFTALADRWEQLAVDADESCADVDPDDQPGVVWIRVSRARTYRTAASEVRDVLEQYGTPEATS